MAVETADLTVTFAIPDLWGLTGWIVGLLISLTSIGYAIYAHRSAEKRKKTIDWAEITKASVDVKNKIVADGNPSVFLALDARSAIFAYKVEEIMPSQVPTMVGFCFSKSDIEDALDFDGYTRVDGVSWAYFIPESLKSHTEGSVVIFDDFTITGRTFGRLIRALEDFGFDKSKIKTASIACTNTAIKSKEAPDYYWIPLDYDEAILPWGRMTP